MITLSAGLRGVTGRGPDRVGDAGVFPPAEPVTAADPLAYRLADRTHVHSFPVTSTNPLAGISTYARQRRFTGKR